MKKILFLVCFLAATTFSQAQSIIPRPHGSRAITLITTADAAGTAGNSYLLDTITITPKEYLTVWRPSASIADTVAIRIKSTSQSHAEDRIVCEITNTAGSNHKIRFVGTGILWHSAGADSVITLTASKKARIVYVFDGTSWVMESKMVQ